MNDAIKSDARTAASRAGLTQAQIDSLKYVIARLEIASVMHECEHALNLRALLTAPPTLPQPVVDALRFYAHGHHYTIDDEQQDFDTVSGEPQNWLHSTRDDDCTMIEDGSIAKAALLGAKLGFEEPTEPIQGEAYAAAPLPPDAQYEAAMSDRANEFRAVES